MNRNDFDALSLELIDALDGDDRVVGLVALGSMAATTREPDEWSDHDFWVVAVDGCAAALRGDLSWLPRHDELAITFAETEHGRSAIYRSGHLVEFAVFDDDELEMARSNLFRVLIDRCNLQARMEAMVRLTTSDVAGRDPNGNDRFGILLSQLTIGVTRAARGEQLSANSLIRGRAAQTLAELLAAFAAPERRDPEAHHATLDNLDPSRRFEDVFPSLAAQMDVALRRSALDCAEDFLDLAKCELAYSIPTATDEAFAAVRTTIDRARQSRGWQRGHQ